MDLWLMSCRVLKRDMELAMLDAIAELRPRHRAIRRLQSTKTGPRYYLPTKKNGMVADFYAKLGFESCLLPETYPGQPSLTEGSTVWSFDLNNYVKQNKHIHVMEYTNG